MIQKLDFFGLGAQLFEIWSDSSDFFPIDTLRSRAFKKVYKVACLLKSVRTEVPGKGILAPELGSMQFIVRLSISDLEPSPQSMG